MTKEAYDALPDSAHAVRLHWEEVDEHYRSMVNYSLEATT